MEWRDDSVVMSFAWLQKIQSNFQRYMTTQNCLQLQFHGISHLFLVPMNTIHLWIAHTYTSGQNSCTCEIKLKTNFKKFHLPRDKMFTIFNNTTKRTFAILSSLYLFLLTAQTLVMLHIFSILSHHVYYVHLFMYVAQKLYLYL